MRSLVKVLLGKVIIKASTAVRQMVAVIRVGLIVLRVTLDQFVHLLTGVIDLQVIARVCSMLQFFKLQNVKLHLGIPGLVVRRHVKPGVVEHLLG